MMVATHIRVSPPRLSLLDVSIGPIQRSEIPAVLDVIARGMRDNPIHVAVYGHDPEERFAGQRQMFEAGFEIAGLDRDMLVARRPDGTVVGVCGMMAPDEALPGGVDQLRLLRRILKLGPGPALRLLRWIDTWSRLDLKHPHWHVGPVAVDPRYQGQGVGTRLMQVFCNKMDAAGEVAYLETDKLINVTFYERFGFEVVHREDVLGVPNWFMRRDPQPVNAAA